MQQAESADIFETLEEGFNAGEISGATTAEVPVQDINTRGAHVNKSGADSVSTVQSSLSEASVFACPVYDLGHASKNPEFASLDFGSQDFSTVMDEFHFDFEDMCYEYSHGTDGEVLA